jgi:hypothetical protein
MGSNQSQSTHNDDIIEFDIEKGKVIEDEDDKEDKEVFEEDDQNIVEENKIVDKMEKFHNSSKFVPSWFIQIY